eukprot:924242-Rhodomonas_salina.1
MSTLVRREVVIVVAPQIECRRSSLQAYARATAVQHGSGPDEVVRFASGYLAFLGAGALVHLLQTRCHSRTPCKAIQSDIEAQQCGTS